MNDLYLIEKLGGYEVAKNAVQNYRDAGDNITMGNMESTLLSYRRKHGIFEVGDKVVLIKGKRALLVMFIVEVKTRTLCIKNRDGATIIFNKLHIRHATDEEIKAGHRL